MTVFVIFFFQAEDGIRDRNVTGVQTCALRSHLPLGATAKPSRGLSTSLSAHHRVDHPARVDRERTRCCQRCLRSEERRVGKECRYRWWAHHGRKKQITRKNVRAERRVYIMCS